MVVPPAPTTSLSDRIARLNLNPDGSPPSAGAGRAPSPATSSSSASSSPYAAGAARVSSKIARFEGQDAAPLLPGHMGSFGMSGVQRKVSNNPTDRRKSNVASLGAGRAAVPLGVVNTTPRSSSAARSAATSTPTPPETPVAQSPSASLSPAQQEPGFVLTMSEDSPSARGSSLDLLRAGGGGGALTPGSISSLVVETGGGNSAAPSLSGSEAFDSKDASPLSSPIIEAVQLSSLEDDGSPLDGTSVSVEGENGVTVGVPPAALTPAHLGGRQKTYLDTLRAPTRSDSIKSLSSLNVEMGSDDGADPHTIADDEADMAATPVMLETPVPDLREDALDVPGAGADKTPSEIMYDGDSANSSYVTALELGGRGSKEDSPSDGEEDYNEGVASPSLQDSPVLQQQSRKDSLPPTSAAPILSTFAPLEGSPVMMTKSISLSSVAAFTAPSAIDEEDVTTTILPPRPTSEEFPTPNGEGAGGSTLASFPSPPRPGRTSGTVEEEEPAAEEGQEELIAKEPEEEENDGSALDDLLASHADADAEEDQEVEASTVPVPVVLEQPRPVPDDVPVDAVPGSAPVSPSDPSPMETIAAIATPPAPETAAAAGAPDVPEEEEGSTGRSAFVPGSPPTPLIGEESPVVPPPRAAEEAAEDGEEPSPVLPSSSSKRSLSGRRKTLMDDSDEEDAYEGGFVTVVQRQNTLMR